MQPDLRPTRWSRPRTPALVLAVACAVVFGLDGCDESSTTQPAPTASPPASETLLFASARSGHSQLYTIAANGEPGSLARVLTSAEEDHSPIWSPDGAAIAFVRTQEKFQNVYVVSEHWPPDSLLCVTDSSNAQSYPVYSPDGHWILYTQDYDNLDLGRIRADGDSTSLVILTDINAQLDTDLGNWGADWSPDGLDMVFTSNRDGNWEIYTASAETRQEAHEHIRITNHAASDWDPAYSPDGEWIAFVSDRHGNADIFIVAADGDPASLRRLTSASYAEADPAWSPAGDWIAYTAYPEGRGAIYVIAADGDPGTRQQIVGGTAGAWAPQWRPH